MSSSFRRALRPAALLALLPLAAAVPSSSPLQGAKPDPQVIEQFGLYSSAPLQAYISRQGKAMTTISDRPGDYGFTIVDSPIINAFATPDGHVYFTRGIMAYFNDEAQFTGVLGHELGHITARHGQKQQTRSTLTSLGLLLGSVVSPNVVGRLAQPLSQGIGVLFLKYSRDNENEADALGVKYSTKTGYDASHMASFFQTLERTEQQSGGSGVPTFLSTHPNSADRYQRVKGLAAQAQQSLGKTALKVNRDSYLRSLDGLVFGDDPRQGFVEGSVFYQPELKLQLPVPAGWKTENTPAQFQMSEPSGKAVLVFTNAPAGAVATAAQSVATQIGLATAQAQSTTLNGFPAVVFEGDQAAAAASSAAPAHVRGYVVQDGSTNYALLGLAPTASFGTYTGQFDQVAQGFRRLTDVARLGRQPDRIRVRQAKTATTLRQALTANGVPSARLEELAIVNGLQLGDQLPAGTLFKVVGK